MNIVEQERRQQDLRIKMTAEKARHEAAMRGLRDEYELSAESQARLLAGLNDELILLAEHIIYVSGDFASAGDEKNWAVNKAIAELTAGGGLLFREYVGTKNYAHWHGQGASHPYGYGPKHGSMIFSIGLHAPVRARIEKKISDEEASAAIYYLRNLVEIQKAQASAAAAAKAVA